MSKMNPFVVRLRKAGLYRGLAESHIQVMLIAERDPIPVQDRNRCTDYNLPSPCPVKGSSLGPLICQKVLRLEELWNGKFYTLTPDGRAYLAKLRDAGLIEQQTAQAI